MDVSIIIACYNGENILEKGVKKIDQILEKTRYSYEIIFVDDHSQDNTRAIINRLVKEKNNRKALFHEFNVGRGGTVADGMKIAQGIMVGFIDIDLQTPAWYIPALISSIENGNDIATAKRVYKLNLGIVKAPHRFLAHKVYRMLLRYLIKTNLTDTETGCKFFKRSKILPVLDETEDKHWFWDTEIMIRSYYKGLKIEEVPTIFIRNESSSSTVRFFKDVKHYVKNLARFVPEARRMRDGTANNTRRTTGQK
ncbi:MAG: glycosyltransferase family 2 protein [Nanoarchaeota archaeon]